VLKQQLCSIRHSVSDCMFHSLMVSLVIPGLAYRKATLAGLPSSMLCRLQSVLNSAARLIGLRLSSWCEDVTPILQDVHWLRNALISSWPMALRHQLSLHPLVVMLAASDPNFITYHCCYRSPMSPAQSLFLPRCMECRHGLVMRILSVRRPSVKRVNCDKKKEKSVQIFIPCERTFSLVF